MNLKKLATALAHGTLRIILHRSIWVLAVIGIITVPAVWALWGAQFSPSIVESFVDDPKEYFEAKRLEDLFPGNPDALVWVATNEGENLFKLETLQAIRSAADEIEQLDAVRRVVALPNVDRPAALVAGMRGTTQKILLNAKLKQGQDIDSRPVSYPILPRGREPSSESLDALAKQVDASKSYATSLLSADRQSHVMLIELREPSQMQPGEQVALIRSLEQITADNGLGEKGFYCSGLVPLQAYAFAELDLILELLLPLGGVLICLSVMYVFRRFEVIVITLIIALISVAWGVGLGIAVFGKFSVLMAAVPLMVLVISTADVVHLVSSYTTDRSHGTPHDVAVTKTFIEVGGACVLTSITTFVGFASLILVPSKTIRQFGFSTAAGVASALLLSVVLVPIFLDLMAKWKRPVVASRGASKWTRSLAHGCMNLGLKHPKSTIGVCLLLLVICVVMTSRLSLDPDLTQRFSRNHPITQSTVFFQEQYAGINSAEILLHADTAQLLAPETLAKIEEFRNRCIQRYQVNAVTSIEDLITEFLKQVDYRNIEGDPESTRHASAIVGYLRKLQPELVDGLLTPDGQYLRILIRIPATSYLEMTRLSDAMRSEAEDLFGPNIEIIEKGSAPLIGRAVREIIRGHLQGFALCFTIIFFLIAFGLRSFRLAWISALPNLTPLLLLGGMVAYFHSVADSDLLAVATLGLGLAVDDTIHFLSRFKLEHKRKQDFRLAMEASIDHTGLAIIRTTLILSLGFLPFAYSGYWSINMLGTYLVVVLAAAVLADLILLPAILALAFPEPSEKQR